MFIRVLFHIISENLCVLPQKKMTAKINKITHFPQNAWNIKSDLIIFKNQFIFKSSIKIKFNN